MKTLNVLLLLVIPFFAFSQNNSSIDFIGSLDYTFRTLNGSDLGSQTVVNSREGEKGRLNWRAGFNYNQRLTDKLILKTGIRMAALGNKNERNDYVLRWGSQNNNGQFDPTLPSGEESVDIESKTNHFLIEAPLVVRYEFSDKKFTPYVEAGFGLMYYLFNRSVVIVNGDKERNLYTLGDDQLQVNAFQVESIIAFGANYSLNENLQFFGQPTFRYHLTTLWDTSVKERLWSAGVEVGLRKFLN